MKNFIYFTIIIWTTIILSACTNETTVFSDQVDPNSKHVEQTKQDTEKDSTIKKSNIKKDTVWLKEKSLLQFKAMDGDHPYTVFLFAEDENRSVLTESSSFGSKRDVIREGNYSVYLSEKDSAIAYKQDIKWDGPLIFNEAKKNSYTFQMGKKTLIAVMQTENASESKVFLLAVKNGEVKRVHTDKELLAYGNKVKAIGQFYLQTVQYTQEQEHPEYGWEFTTYSFDQQSLELSEIDVTRYEDELHASRMGTGQYWYEKWMEKDTTYFPFHNLSIEPGMILRARLGVLQGSQYPIGTNIAEITKSNSNVVEEGKMKATSYIMYPEVTYYVDEKTGNVVSLTIPGQRFKTTMKQVVEQIGSPAEKKEDSLTGEITAYYPADKYILEIVVDPSGNVKEVILKKEG